jgi:DNA-binding NtrC family response regulator
MLRLSATHDEKIRLADVPAGATELGASPDCGIHIPFPGVSRRHARVEPVPDGLRLVDLGSKNGLRQKGRRLPELTLRPGDSVTLGRARLTLESVDTSDALLAERARRRPATPQGREPEADTDTVASEQSGRTPPDALRLLREIERAGTDLAGENGRDLLERAAQLLGATSLFTASRASQGVALHRLSGSAPPDEATLAKAFEIAAEASDEEAASGTIGGARSMIVCRMGNTDDAPIFAAVLPSPRRHLDPWRRDLLSYLAHRLQTAAVVKRPPPSKNLGPAALVLPSGFVRGRAAATLRLMSQLQAAIRSTLDVLILGETGTGKEYVARIIHDSGPTARGPFVAINCAAIPSELLEAELFGVKARVATGVDPRPGLLTRAAGGSVFLDEIGDMPEALQAKLLRALQEREVMPVGAHQPEPIQVRVLSSTNKDLTAMVRAHGFRADLYFRLRGLEFTIPPLRERVEDIAPLALAFAERAALTHDKEIAGISRRALNLIEGHDWPGNVRELRSEIERAVLLCPGGGTLSSQFFESLRRPEDGGGAAASDPPDLPPRTTGVLPVRASVTTLAHRVADVETQAIREALTASRGNRAEAARALGITRNGLALKIKRLRINPID